MELGSVYVAHHECRHSTAARACCQPTERHGGGLRQSSDWMGVGDQQPRSRLAHINQIGALVSKEL